MSAGVHTYGSERLDSTKLCPLGACTRHVLVAHGHPCGVRRVVRVACGMNGEPSKLHGQRTSYKGVAQPLRIQTLANTLRTQCE